MTTPNTKTEILVGAFVMLGIAALGYLSISIGGLQLVKPDSYVLKARFASVGDLKQGAPIRLAGVKVGQVASVKLKDYSAEAELSIGRALVLPKDSVASIRSEGLLGNTYVSLTPGGSLENLHDGGLVSQTEPAINLSNLLARYAFGQHSAPAEPASSGGGPGKDEVFSDPLR
ncbi:MAG TPA: outer membrane lipid asymmetry maintenance protein MlaD [Polyangiaceae bacterium]|nr:outer membrane lipid asymmetry maintenance protein MlaD [Polyangiaceae bacterium]